MALKDDLFNKLKNDKYYLEKDLQALIDGTNVTEPYEIRLNKIILLLKKISHIATAFSLVDIYIPEKKEDNDTAVS